MDLCGRPCSKRHRLPCVPEGPPFVAAAFSAGEGAPFRKCGRGCVVEGAPRVHAGAPGSKIIDFSLMSISPYCCEGNTMHFGPSCNGLRNLCCLGLSVSKKNEIALKNVREVDVVDKPFASQSID